MCLNSVEDRVPDEYANGGIGYKVVTRHDDLTLRGADMMCALKPIGELNVAVKVPVVYNRERGKEKLTYTSGFHVFTSGFHVFVDLEGAQNYAIMEYELIIKVRFDKPLHFGRQDGYDVVVAEEITVLEELPAARIHSL